MATQPSASISELEPPSPQSNSGDRVKQYAMLCAILLTGIAFRVWLISDPSLGDEFDLGLFRRYTHNLYEHGLGGFYAAETFCDYPPAMVLMFHGIGHAVAAALGNLPSDELLRVFLKIPACLADIMIGLLLFWEGRRLLSRRCGVAAAALFVLNPVVIYDSAYWGQLDSIYIAFILLALVCVRRRHWFLCGAATAAALLLKFQAVALVPLIVFEAYRLGLWRAVARKMLGAICLAAGVLMPFLWHGMLGEAIRRSYIDVVGQYNNLSKGAFNLWQLTGAPLDSDTAIPKPITRIVANGAVKIADHASWLLSLNWRIISLVIYSLSVAVVLSLYARKPGPVRRYGAAGLLALAFFLFPTEMHERYALAAIAMLPIWALSGAWRERAFFLLSALLLLNLAAVVPIQPIAPHIGVAFFLIFAVMVVGMSLKRESHPSRPTDLEEPVADKEDHAKQLPLIRAFQRLTIAGLVAAFGLGGWIAYAAANAPAIGGAGGELYLSTLNPRSVQQGWRQLSKNHAVSGGMLRLDGHIFLKGLGTHAPSIIVYKIPEGYDEFRAIVGIDTAVKNRGSVRVSIKLDDREVYTSELLSGNSEPAEIRVPLSGVDKLSLHAAPTRDGKRWDHVDWALARLTKSVSLPESAPALDD